MRTICIILLLLIISPYSYSQGVGKSAQYGRNEKLKKELKYISLNGGIYATQYLGDINPNPLNTFLHNRSTDIALSLEIEKRLAKQISFSGGFAWIRLTADDYYLADQNTEEGINNYIRNLSFRNDVWELALKAKIHLKKNNFGYMERPFFNPYFFIGAGVMYHNPKARIPEFTFNHERFENAGRWTDLRPLGTEGQHSAFNNVSTYSYFQPVIPLGLGLTFKINSYLDMSFEASFRYTFTDYIDDVSGDYVDLGSLNGDLAKTMSYRSNEVNSSNGRNPRNFELIYSNTQPTVYTSLYDGNSYQVVNGFGNEGNRRGDDQHSDFYILTGFKLTYILVDKKSKKHEY